VVAVLTVAAVDGEGERAVPSDPAPAHEPALVLVALFAALRSLRIRIVAHIS